MVEHCRYTDPPAALQDAPIEFADSEYWRSRFGLPQVEMGLPELDEHGRCDRSDCPGKGGRIPGFQKEQVFNRGKAVYRVQGAIHIYCPSCHREQFYDLPLLPRADNPPPILGQGAGMGTVEVVNLRSCQPSILSDPGVVYVGRQVEGWKGQNLHASPLANPYRVGFHGDRNEVCEQFLARELNPALERCFGPVWESVLALAKRVLAGESLKLACWCSPERCHAYDLAAAIMSVANQLNRQR